MAKRNFFQRWFSGPPQEERGIGNTVGGWDWFLNAFNSLLSSDTDSGEQITVEKGTKIDVAFSCINALAQDVAKLPYNVRQDTDKGKVIVKNNIYRLIHSRPNSYTSAFNFWYNIIFNMLSWGNGYAYIKRKGVEPVELIVLHPNDVTPIVIEGQIFYQYKSAFIPDTEILHYKLYSFDGILGVSPIIHSANTFGYRVKQEKYSAKVLGQKPPGILSFDQNLTSEQRTANQESWQKSISGDNLGKTPVLSGGAKYIPLMIPPAEGQMIEAAELNDERIAGIYRVPPTIIQNYKRATFSNAEQQDLVYAKYALTPIIRVIEQETDYKLFTEKEKVSDSPPYTKFNINAMLQGDIKTRSEWYKMLRSYGLASANTILELEDLPPLEGDQGDLVVVQGAYIPLDQLREFYSGKPGAEDDLRSKQIGFDVQSLKDALDKFETMNKA